MPRLIDADKAYKVLTDYYHQRTEIQHKALKEALSRVPTVDAEPVRHGHWITQFDDLFPMESTIECSICGEKEWMMTIINHNYCPNCGARMDEGIEDAD